MDGGLPAVRHCQIRVRDGLSIAPLPAVPATVASSLLASKTQAFQSKNAKQLFII